MSRLLVVLVLVLVLVGCTGEGGGVSMEGYSGAIECYSSGVLVLQAEGVRPGFFSGDPDRIYYPGGRVVAIDDSLDCLVWGRTSDG